MLAGVPNNAVGFSMLALLSFIAPAYFAFSCGAALPVIPLKLGSAEIQVELATTPATRACGLSNRDRLDPDKGMLFVFPEAAPRAFWMKDTHVALSIAFLDAERQVINIHDMVPLQTDERYPSDGPARYALEVNVGGFAAHEIGVGDVVEFNLPRVMLVE